MPDVFFVTNRNPIPTNDAPTAFGPDKHERGPGYLRLGRAHLADWAGPSKAPDDLAIDAFTVYPEQIQGPAKMLGSAAFFHDMETLVFDAQGNCIRDVLLYVHGFETTFPEALRFAGQAGINLELQRRRLVALRPELAAQSKPCVVVVFTWPSDGTMVPELSYWDDRRDAEDSGVAVSRLLLKLRDYLQDRFKKQVSKITGSDRPPLRALREIRDSGALDCGVRIHLMVQSMGNFVLRHGLQQFKKEQSVGANIPRLFDQIFSTGADEDSDAFSKESMLRDLPDLARQVTVYCNPADQALLVSMTTKHLGRRLGQNGPKNVIDIANLYAVDVSNVIEHDDGPGHYYGRLNPTVQTDIAELMAGVRPENASCDVRSAIIATSSRTASPRRHRLVEWPIPLKA